VIRKNHASGRLPEHTKDNQPSRAHGPIRRREGNDLAERDAERCDVQRHAGPDVQGWRAVEDSSSFGYDDLLLVAKALNECHSWIHAQFTSDPARGEQKED